VVAAELRPAPRPAGKGKGLWLGLAALALLAVAGAAWWTLKDRGTVPGAASTEAKAEPSPQPEVKATTGAIVPARGTASSPSVIAPQATQNPAAPLPSTKPDAPAELRPEPARPAPPKPAPTKTGEAKAIDQPELYQPEKLDKLEVHERKNLGNVSMSEAIQISESQPDKAIHGFRQAIKADPTNARARAWLAWVLFQQGRHAEFVQELRDGRRAGLLGQMVNQHVQLKRAFQRARLNQQLPPDLAD
jgi:tetratricopeptide (TPR) repeat protein